MVDPRVEELLEQMYVRQVEGDESVAVGADDEVVAAAIAAGYVAAEGNELRLTDAGRPVARGTVRRHRLAERLLRDVLAVNAAEVDADACRFEHILQPALEEKICALLGHPSSCPHGRPIPPGDCCLQARQEGVREVGPLCDGQAGDEGAVAFLTTRDEKEVQKLMVMGILPGADIRLLRRFPSFVFQVGYSQFSVDQQLAEKIMVHWHERPWPRSQARRHRHGQRHGGA